MTEPTTSGSTTPYPHRNLDRLYCATATYLCAIGSLPRSDHSHEHHRQQNRRHPHRQHRQQKRRRPVEVVNTEEVGTVETECGSKKDGSIESHFVIPGVPCIPCAYKICNFDTALDLELSKLVPNQRPEQCPRSSHGFVCTSNASSAARRNRSSNEEVQFESSDGMMGYQRGMSVLTVGDGDFSFSLAVARLVMSEKDLNKTEGGGDCGTVVATSYEDSVTLRKVYPDFDVTLNSLDSYGVVKGYNVDGTCLEETLPKEHKRKSSSGSDKFHRICWNFPCTAIGDGQDGQNEAMEQNKELVRKFFVSALPFLDEECGEIHMAHKTKPPYNQWGLEKVALEGVAKIIEQSNVIARRTQFEFKGRIVFDKCTLPPYTPRKALDRKSFPCHDACVYVFGWKKCGNGAGSVNESPYLIQKIQKKFLSTIPEAEVEELNCESLNPSSIIPVTESLIKRVRSIHLRHSGVTVEPQEDRQEIELSGLERGSNNKRKNSQRYRKVKRRHKINT